MTKSQQQGQLPSSKQSIGWGEIIGLALLAGVVAMLVMSGRNQPQGQSLVLPGTPLPPLQAAGWLNTESAPTKESLAGKVVVMDCWATWCPPCRKAMPELAELYTQYKPLGVEFIGLTPEEPGQLPVIESFVKSVDGFDWPVGYYAIPTLSMLDIELLPTVIVFSPTGAAVWSGDSRMIGIENAIDQALALVKK